MIYRTVATGAPSFLTPWHNLSNSRLARWGRRIASDAKRGITAAPVKPNPGAWRENGITLSWLGHSTVLINFYGVHILTDPVLKNRVGLDFRFGILGPKRYIAPALTLTELPPIDVVLLSHAHHDHFDSATLRALRSRPWVATAASTGDLLRRFDDVNELAWGKSAVYKGAKGELSVEAIEVKHWGQRWPSSLRRGYNGYILKREGKSLLFGGDTAYTPAFMDARSRGPFEVAIMPIGAYQPWIWNHCTPEQALAMANAAGANYIVPVHHQTFRFSDEPMLEPIERLQSALHKEPGRLALRQVGETFICPTS